jgi:hypothetical protein
VVKGRRLSWYLHWESLKRDRPEAVAVYSLPEPFDPLIRLYERGGDFYTERGFINVGVACIPAKVRGWQAFDSTVPFVALLKKRGRSLERQSV